MLKGMYHGLIRQHSTIPYFNMERELESWFKHYFSHKLLWFYYNNDSFTVRDNIDTNTLIFIPNVLQELSLIKISKSMLPYDS